MTTIAAKLQQVRARIATACRQAGRNVEDVTLLAVSKTFGPQAVRAAADAGQLDFGENYLQEGVDKIAALADLRGRLRWHCIGPIQSNKTRLVAEHFDWAHSVERLKIAERLSAQRPADRPPLNVCLQVNIDGGPTKSGVAPAEALALARAVAALPRLRLRGLMTIPEPAPDFEAARAVHASARALFDQMNAAGLGLDTLSMGMSDDLEAAIAAGSTLVRVGSAIFGARPPKT
ncbi:MAG: YggS family pyridoxal phosphate-dependent enzyme [Rubrivivax sp.]|uniref:YggS family pyridoxal phosphate-dependent enzyme n=1 Tax=Ottowia sp. TaxID=1898956 RepID=UPI002178F622|nr:YggS family pyridoxal phosphate-dependent enzyme [Ottowia sp.]MCC6814651.1 YggS family pyridoxal phosphate-dependent enzyme [Rubrivivax sp.]HNR83295.1 YggS family pyridoxal phosphate-dependent enzyme [Ottowia sp.]HQO54169.1 YggS family pyridoxal phosphate-dependent enzyme [Ottowia sp.]